MRFVEVVGMSADDKRNVMVVVVLSFALSLIACSSLFDADSVPPPTDAGGTGDCSPPCQPPQTCGGSGTPGVCGCAAESDEQFCVRLGADCGDLVALDNCGVSRTVECGRCELPAVCGREQANRCSCPVQNDLAFCEANDSFCGDLTSLDACGLQREVYCGGCPTGQECVPDQVGASCACVPETDEELCAENSANCGELSVEDSCGVERLVSCGICTLPETCGGAGVPNVCGCGADIAVCAGIPEACGPVDVSDRCGNVADVDCGGCLPDGGCGTDNLCSCPLGFRGDGFVCSDRNECADATDLCADNATCLNTVGSYDCACADGYAGDGFACADVDECGLGSDNCHPGRATCSNTEGSFSCACNDGFSGDGVTCTDNDECAQGTAGCHPDAGCENEIGGFRCTCDDGYEGDGFACTDIDECARNTDNCFATAMCTNTPGGFTCQCPVGLVGDGVTCVSPNACGDSGDCHPDATCDPGDGICLCNPGFVGDGLSCADVDECLQGTDDCPANSTCNNTTGSFDCTCDAGYEAAGNLCVDIDECVRGSDDCDANASCTNTSGGFVCMCNAGYSGDGTSCTDDDECAEGTDNCDGNASCTNTPGAFTCQCLMGFSGNGESCTDIDECSTGADDCDPLAGCTNTVGSFVCGDCPAGYLDVNQDGTLCNDIDECAAGTANCHTQATCANTPGSFTCTCNAGYTGNGTSCSDVNECAAGTHNCDPNATCGNLVGSFSCTCNAGYEGDGVSCSPAVIASIQQLEFALAAGQLSDEVATTKSVRVPSTVPFVSWTVSEGASILAEMSQRAFLNDPDTLTSERFVAESTDLSATAVLTDFGAAVRVQRGDIELLGDSDGALLGTPVDPSATMFYFTVAPKGTQQDTSTVLIRGDLAGSNGQVLEVEHSAYNEDSIHVRWWVVESLEEHFTVEHRMVSMAAGQQTLAVPAATATPGKSFVLWSGLTASRNFSTGLVQCGVLGDNEVTCQRADSAEVVELQLQIVTVRSPAAVASGAITMVDGQEEVSLDTGRATSTPMALIPGLGFMAGGLPEGPVDSPSCVLGQVLLEAGTSELMFRRFDPSCNAEFSYVVVDWGDTD